LSAATIFTGAVKLFADPLSEIFAGTFGALVADSVVTPPAFIAESAVCVMAPPVLVTVNVPVSFTFANWMPPTASTKVTALACSIVTGPAKLFDALLNVTAAGTTED
jgi:hypothetical protein